VIEAGETVAVKAPVCKKAGVRMLAKIFEPLEASLRD
jgi:hypothetical protein